MQITTEKAYTLLIPTEKLLEEFVNELHKKLSDFKKKHLIVDFSDTFNIKNEEFLLFLNIATEKRKNGTSFVIVIAEIDVDNIPDEINVVPTITEAIDIIEMEAIERDLMDF